MRTHRVFPALQPWALQIDALRDLARAEFLTAMRIEPVTRSREPAAFVDLHFADGERRVTVPLVYVDLAQLEIREADPLVFPHAPAAAISNRHAAEIVECVYADLERRALAGGFWNEEAIVYRPAFAAAFERARAAGWFGAAPLAATLPRIAPAVYARRFAIGKHVAAYGSAASEIAAFLRADATSCALLDHDGSMARWYGDVPEPAAGGGEFDVIVGHGPAPAAAATVVRLDAAGTGTTVAVAAALPADVMISFDSGDVPVAARFSVAASREPFVHVRAPLPDAPVIGGSAGRVAVVVRPDAVAVPDADTDEASALAAVLRREGFAVRVVAGLDDLEAFAPDLVHLFGVRPGGFARRVADWAAEHRRALAVHAYFEAPMAGGYWGAMVAPYCFGYSADERNVAGYLDLLARRAVVVDGIGATAPYAPAGAGLADAERVLRTADVVFVNSERERDIVAGIRTNRPIFKVPALALEAGAVAPIGHLVGNDPFVLVHAPIGPHGNQLMLARAALSLNVPVVLTGPVEDPAYVERLREFAPEKLMLFGELAPAETAALYRAAAVVADAAWVTRGHARLVNAADRGAAIVVSRSRWLELSNPDRWVVDPASVESIARGIGEAWDAFVSREPEIATVAAQAREAVTSAGLAIVAGYAKIAACV